MLRTGTRVRSSQLRCAPVMWASKFSVSGTSARVKTTHALDGLENVAGDASLSLMSVA